MNIEKIKLFLGMADDLYKDGIIAVDMSDKDIHMRNEQFMELPRHGVQFESTGREEYPWEAYSVIDGIKFFTLLTKESYEQYTQPYMHEDVKLDGMPEKEGGKIA